MKNFYLFFLTLLIISCNKSKGIAEVELKYEGDQPMEIRTPIDDIMLWDNKKETLKKGIENTYSFKKEIEKPELAVLNIGKKRIKSLLIPGEKIKISFNDSSFNFLGKNKKGLELLNKIESPVFTVNQSSRFKRDTTASQIKRKIDSLKKEDLKELKVLEENDRVDDTFLKTLEDEINYFYALRTLQVIISKQNQSFPIDKNVIKLFDQTVNKYPLDITYKPSSWLEYAKEVLLAKKLYDRRVTEELTVDSIIKLYENDKYFEYQFNIISNYKDPHIAEKVAAYNLINSTKQDNYEKSLISVFESFKNEYPNSNYIPYLKPEIDRIMEYHQKTANKMPDGVKFIEGENLKDFKELVAELKGEKYYIDIWATWCGPCKVEFKHNQKLDRLLNKRGYKKLLISVDQPEREQKWKNDIKYYELAGLNIRASKKLYSDLINNYGVNSIPKYFIIDKEGNLVNQNAPKPSNIEELQKVL